MIKLVKIIDGEHAGTVAHVTSNTPQYGGLSVTPIYGDPPVSIYLRRHQVERIDGYWICNKCRADNITAFRHAGCNYGATFYKR